MKILLAIDGSEVSLRAVRSLIEHVRWFREPPELHLLHVHLPVPIGLATHPISRETLETYYREESEAALAGARQLLEDAGFSSTLHIHVGQPAELIVKVAKELGCEMVCMGSHGHSVLKNAILGSVATKVLQLVKVPLLLVK